MRQLTTIALLLVLATSAHGAIIGGDALMMDAPGLIGPDSINQDKLYAFDERQRYTLTQALKTDSGILAAGTVVNSHYIFFDPKYKSTLSAKLSFDGQILGVISKTRMLRKSDHLGHASTTYKSFYQRGLEYGRGYDNLFSGPDGKTLTLTLRAKTPGDYIRVLTSPVDPRTPPPGPATPEPSAALLFGIGLALVKLRTRRP